MFTEEIRNHLVNDLIPFWDRLRDDEYGGFYGFMDADLVLDKKANKGGILNSRIMWFFSNAYLLLRDDRCLRDAKQAYELLRDAFVDRECGGIYWSVTYDGKPADDQKHAYNTAFAIYGLSSYYDASKDPEALQLAMTLFRVVEERMRDEGGYLESFRRDFGPLENKKLSEHGVNASRTMNTLLHMLEAYTELYRVCRDPEVGVHIREMLDIVHDKVYNAEKRRQECFFDLQYHSLVDLHSYGHDIEASWLVERTLEVLGEQEYTDKILPILHAVRDCTLEQGFSGDYLYNECGKEGDDKTAVWWVQAETIVALVNAYEKMPGHPEYLEKAEKVWAYVKKYLINYEAGGEWHSETDPDGTDHRRPMVSLWKCPYHNGRMCMEVLKRLDK